MEVNVINMDYESFGVTKNSYFATIGNLSSSTDVYCKS